VTPPAASPPRMSFASASADDRAFACALCGLRFTHGGQVCASCPIAHGCEDIVRCPRCGYQFPSRSRVVDWLQALRAWWRRPAAPAASHPVQTLDRLRPGQRGTVLSVAEAEPAMRLKLSHLGLAPGAEVSLEQSRPAAVIRVGETTIALQLSIARGVHVRIAGDPRGEAGPAHQLRVTPA
jgi:Fe2+ transport system protein FeoA